MNSPEIVITNPAYYFENNTAANMRLGVDLSLPMTMQKTVVNKKAGYYLSEKARLSDDNIAINISTEITVTFLRAIKAQNKPSALWLTFAGSTAASPYHYSQYPDYKLESLSDDAVIKWITPTDCILELKPETLSAEKSTSIKLKLTVKEDDIYEPNETIVMKVKSYGMYKPNPKAVLPALTILSDNSNAKPFISFTHPSPKYIDEGSKFVIRINRNKDEVRQALKVYYEIGGDVKCYTGIYAYKTDSDQGKRDYTPPANIHADLISDDKKTDLTKRIYKNGLLACQENGNVLGVLTIPAKKDFVSITITTLKDAAIEANEEMIFTLKSSADILSKSSIQTNYGVTSDSSIKHIIRDTSLANAGFDVDGLDKKTLITSSKTVELKRYVLEDVVYADPDTLKKSDLEVKIKITLSNVVKTSDNKKLTFKDHYGSGKVFYFADSDNEPLTAVNLVSGIFTTKIPSKSDSTEIKLITNENVAGKFTLQVQPLAGKYLLKDVIDKYNKKIIISK